MSTSVYLPALALLMSLLPVIHGATRFTRTFWGCDMAAVARMIPSNYTLVVR